MIEAARLARRRQAECQRACFQTLGEAEAKVHGVPHRESALPRGRRGRFHLRHRGRLPRLRSARHRRDLRSPINVGSGTVNTEHGVLPVPAPATAELLAGKPVYARGPAMELTTPTGAAIVATLAREFGPYARHDNCSPPATAPATAISRARQRAARPDRRARRRATKSTTVAVLEANIDDSSPQVLGYAMERLLRSGRAGCHARARCS